MFSIGTIGLLDTFQYVETIEFEHKSIKAKNGSTKLSSTQFVSVNGKTANRYKPIIVLKEKNYPKNTINISHGMFK